MRDIDLVAKWFEDIGPVLRRRVAACDVLLQLSADELLIRERTAQRVSV